MSADGPRARGRPRQFDPAQALNQARGAFWNAGYSATSLDDLSGATGLNRPSLYGAFGDKRALFLKALTASRDESLSALSAALAPEEPLEKALNRVWRAATDIYLAGEEGARGCFVIGTAVVESVGDTDVRRILADTEEGLDALFAARFERARAAGELSRAADPTALALIATATLNTLSIRARSGADRPALEAVGRAATSLICAA
jgi:AcrR family transcriptional regulator